MSDDIKGRTCGRSGCKAPAIDKVYADLTYYTCAKHRAEILALTARERGEE